jgi:hypothetical protein
MSKVVSRLTRIATGSMTSDRTEAAALYALAQAYRRASRADQAYLLAVAQDLGRGEDLEMEQVVARMPAPASRGRLRLVQGGGRQSR